MQKKNGYVWRHDLVVLYHPVVEETWAFQITMWGKNRQIKDESSDIQILSGLKAVQQECPKYIRFTVHV